MDAKTKKAVHMVVFSLVIIGALNWGLVGLFNLDLVKLVLGPVEPLDRIVYVLVGISAVYLAATHMGDCKICGSSKS